MLWPCGRTPPRMCLFVALQMLYVTLCKVHFILCVLLVELHTYCVLLYAC